MIAHFRAACACQNLNSEGSGLNAKKESKNIAPPSSWYYNDDTCTWEHGTPPEETEKRTANKQPWELTPQEILKAMNPTDDPDKFPYKNRSLKRNMPPENIPPDDTYPYGQGNPDWMEQQPPIKKGAKNIDDIPLKELFPDGSAYVGSTFLGKNATAVDNPIDPNVDPNPPDDPPPPDPTPPPPTPPAQCPNYHPDHTSVPGGMSQANTVRAITAYVNSKGYRHDPDGIPWLSPSSWPSWDGVTTYNPCVLTKNQLVAGIFPPPGGINTMRGLRQLFYQVNPFADNQNPTVAEIENWNIEVIRLFRRLLGFNQTSHPVSNDKCTYLKAAWAEERLRTSYWDASYPGTQDSATGPCTKPISSNAHCGGGFIPNATDQMPYLCPSTMGACGATSGAEGIANHNADIPWSIKMSRIIGNYLQTDGIGAHTGPFVGRALFGSAWWINPNNPASIAVRTKWSGSLAPTCP